MAGPPANLFTATEYNPDKEREHVRSGVIWTFIVLFVVIILGYLCASLSAAISDPQWIRFKEVIAVALPAVTGTLGTTLGFYFGTQAKK